MSEEGELVSKEFVSKKRKLKIIDIFSPNICDEKIEVDIGYIGKNIKEVLRKRLAEKFEGTCCRYGYVKQDSLSILNYSAGIIEDNKIIFTCTIEMLVCLPVEGMIIECQAKNITKAGIRCESKDSPSPVVVFIARDHHFKMKEFAQLNVDDEITVRVIGIRYELNDEYISVIAELVTSRKPKKKPIKIIIKSKK